MILGLEVKIFCATAPPKSSYTAKTMFEVRPGPSLGAWRKYGLCELTFPALATFSHYARVSEAGPAHIPV